MGTIMNVKGFITAEKRSLQALNRICNGQAKFIVKMSAKRWFTRMCCAKAAVECRAQ